MSTSSAKGSGHGDVDPHPWAVAGHLPWGWVPPGRPAAFLMASRKRRKSRGLRSTSGDPSTLNLESDHRRHSTTPLGNSRYRKLSHPLGISSRPTAGHLLSYPRQGRQQLKSQVLNPHRAALGATAALQDGLWWGGPSPGVRIPPGNQFQNTRLNWRSTFAASTGWLPSDYSP